MANINKVVKLNRTRVRTLVKEFNKPDKQIAQKYLTAEWIRITEEQKMIDIFGFHTIEAARMIENWFVAIHVTDPYFRTAREFDEMQQEIFTKFATEFKDLAFNKGYTKEILQALSVFEIAVLLHKECNIELKIDPLKATYVVWQREILTKEEYEGYFVDQLKEECRFFGLRVSGTKEELINRLLEAKNTSN